LEIGDAVQEQAADAVDVQVPPQDGAQVGAAHKEYSAFAFAGSQATLKKTIAA